MDHISIIRNKEANRSERFKQDRRKISLQFTFEENQNDKQAAIDENFFHMKRNSQQSSQIQNLEFSSEDSKAADISMSSRDDSNKSSKKIDFYSNQDNLIQNLESGDQNTEIPPQLQLRKRTNVFLNIEETKHKKEDQDSEPPQYTGQPMINKLEVRILEEEDMPYEQHQNQLQNSQRSFLSPNIGKFGEAMNPQQSFDQNKKQIATPVFTNQLQSTQIENSSLLFPFKKKLTGPTQRFSNKNMIFVRQLSASNQSTLMNIQPAQGESSNPFRQICTLSGSLNIGKQPQIQSKDTDEISLKFSEEEEKKDNELLHKTPPLHVKENSIFNLQKAGLGDSPEINLDPRDLEEQINKNRLEQIYNERVRQLTKNMLKVSEDIDLSENFASKEGIKRKNRKRCIIYPEDSLRKNVDIIISICLMITGIMIPLLVAFSTERQLTGFAIVDYVTNAIFSVNIILTFFTSVYDEERDLITDKKEIARRYLKGWFLIDIISVIPFDYVNSQGGLNRITRITRIGKIYRVIRLSKMLRLLNFFHQKNKLIRFISIALRITVGFQRLIYMAIMFIIFSHVANCLLIFMAKFKIESYDTNNWISQYELTDVEDSELYITGLYLTITTVVTVGFGDIVFKNKTEKFAAILLMLLGNFTFSLMQGHFWSIFSNFDDVESEYLLEINIIQELQYTYNLSTELVHSLLKVMRKSKLKKSIRYINFINELPYRLKQSIAEQMHVVLFQQAVYFKNKNSAFLSWIGLLLIPENFSESEFITQEGEEINHIYFMTRGLAGYVLQNFENFIYITVDDGDMFGHVDIALHKRALENEIKHQNLKTEEDQEYSKSVQPRQIMFKRLFSIQSLTSSECISFSIDQLEMMRQGFPEEWTDLMLNSYKRFSIESNLKLKAQKTCHRQFNNKQDPASPLAEFVSPKQASEQDDTASKHLQRKVTGLQRSKTIVTYNQRQSISPMSKVSRNAAGGATLEDEYEGYASLLQNPPSVKQIEHQLEERERMRAMGNLDEYYHDMSDTSSSQSDTMKNGQPLSSHNNNIINEVQHTTFRSDKSAVVDDKKSEISSLGGSRIGGHQSNITEENFRSPNKFHRFKDRPETIDHDVLVGALKQKFPNIISNGIVNLGSFTDVMLANKETPTKSNLLTVDQARRMKTLTSTKKERTYTNLQRYKTQINEQESSHTQRNEYNSQILSSRSISDVHSRIGNLENIIEQLACQVTQLQQDIQHLKLSQTE